jgi:2-C-methyl-D-erythritol 4-phosphate cytidylyltransferase
MPDVVGVIPLIARESLGYAELGGAALFVSAVSALRSAGVEPVLVVAGSGGRARATAALRGLDPAVELVECPEQAVLLHETVSSARTVVIHDPLCPLVSPAAIREAVSDWVPGTASVCVLPVLDTVKAARDGLVLETVDRDALRIVGSPVVVPGALLGEVADLTAALSRPTGLVEWLQGRCPVSLVAAPLASQRVEDVSSLEVLSALGAVTGAEGARRPPDRPGR